MYVFIRQMVFWALCRQDCGPKLASGYYFFGQESQVELIFLNLLCQLYAADRYGRSLESLESEHRPDSLFYPAMVLLDDGAEQRALEVASSKLQNSQLKLPLTHASCPSTVVSDPVQIVWLLLTDPARWGDFFDVRITRVELAGSAVIGQRFYGESGPRFLHIGLKFEFTEVNEAQHQLGLNVQLPFWHHGSRRPELHSHQQHQMSR